MNSYSKPALWVYGFLVVSALVGQLRSFPIPEFREKVSTIFCAGFIFLGFISIGDLFVRLLEKFNLCKIEIDKRNFAIAIRFGLGLSFFSSLVLLAGKVQIWNLSGKLSALALLLGLASIESITNRRYLGYMPEINLIPTSKWEFLLVVSAIVGLAGSFIPCFSPITYYDALVYHLGLPAHYILTGNITNPSTNLYYFFPQNMEMIFLFVLSRLPNPEYIINLLGWGISFFVSTLIYTWSFELGGRKAAIMGFVLWWTMPAVLFLSLGAYVDVPLAFFVLLSFRLSFLAQSQEHQRGLLFYFSGLFSGAAFSTKYTGAITFLILFSYLIFLPGLNLKFKLKNMFFFILGFLIPSAPWLFKNFSEVGNPVFPFFYKYFGTGQTGWTEQTATGYFEMLTEYGTSSHVFWELLLSPWKITGASTVFGGGFDVLGDFGWLPVLFSIPGLFITLKKKDYPYFLFISCALYFVFWFLTKPVLRFLVSGLPLFTILAALSFGKWGYLNEHVFKKVMFIVFPICLFSNFFIFGLVQSEIQPYSVSMGWEKSQDFLNRKLNYFSAFQKINTASIEDEKTLIIGEQRIFHLNAPSISSNLFGPSYISDICNNSSSIEEIGVFLKQKKITKISIHESEIKRLGGLEKLGFNPSGIQLLWEYIDKKTSLYFDSKFVKIFLL